MALLFMDVGSEEATYPASVTYMGVTIRGKEKKARVARAAQRVMVIRSICQGASNISEVSRRTSIKEPVVAGIVDDLRAKQAWPGRAWGSAGTAKTATTKTSQFGRYSQ
jgi:hypothetical protein